MARVITLVEGDTAKPVTGTLYCTNDAGELVPQDLTGATLELHLRAQDPGAVRITWPVTVTAPLLGRYTIDGAVRATLASGEYEVEMVVVYGDGSRDVFPSDERALLINRARRT